MWGLQAFWEGLSGHVTWGKSHDNPLFTFLMDYVVFANTGLQLRSWACQWINDLELLIAYPGLRDLFQLLPSPGEILGLLKEGIWVFHIEFEANVSAALCIRCLIPKRMKLIERASYYPEILDFELCVGSQWDFRLSLWQKRFWMFSKQKEE